ncbi:MAG TPA: dihydrolipoamide acetyltransferase family protein [Dehalococcoidia bacterium]|nr:dihydrolipoamide acetyltransferase family protein [Dehalococcoidia bacterium]
MATEVIMPQMGADMQEGTLLRWLKQPGEHVARGEIIAEIETDKANVEIESFIDGVLSRTLAAEGQVVPVGEVIALIEAGADAAVSAPSAAAPPAPEPVLAAAGGAVEPPPVAAPVPAANGAGGGEQVREPVAAGAAPPASDRGELRTPPDGSQIAGPGQRLRVSPVARNIAEELGVDLRSLQGSGPEGRIMRKDVERAAAQGQPAAASAATAAPAAQPAGGVATIERPAAAPSPAPAEPVVPRRWEQPAEPAATPVSTQPAAAQAAPPPAPRPAAPAAPQRPAAAPAAGVQPFSKMRQAIARRMAQSKREAPHYYVTAEIDMTEAMAFRAQLNQAAPEGLRVSVNDLIVKACAETLKRYTPFNAAYGDDGLHLNERINVCIGVALPDGLIAPALLDVGVKSLGTIAAEAHDLAERARSGMMRPAELNDGTFTISNLGMYGIETLIPIIQPPQAAILGVGAVEDKPAVREGQIVIRKLMMVALAADHRVTDGAQGGEFLRDLKELLEHPLRLAL